MLYDSLLRLYWFFILLFSLWHKKAKKWIRGRKNWKNTLESVPFAENLWIWFHVSSLGEFEEGRTVIKKIKQNYPQYKVLLSFFSPSGYEQIKDSTIADVIIYLPIDTKSNAKYFIEIVKPKVIFFVRNDIWRNYLCEAHNKNIPVFFVAAFYASNNIIFSFLIKRFYIKAFESFTVIFTIDENTKVNLETNFNLKNVVLTGSTRLEAVLEVANYEKEANSDLNCIFNWIGDDYCVIAGSALDRDLAILVKSYLKLTHLNIKWIWVPHEINSIKIDRFIVNYPFVSKVSSKELNTNFICVDQVGILKHIYKKTNLALIGGGFNSIGIHNIIEPAFYNNFIVTGPNHRNYQEAIDFIALKWMAIVYDENDLINKIESDYKPFLEGEKNNYSKYFKLGTGATNKIEEIIRPYL